MPYEGGGPVRRARSHGRGLVALALITFAAVLAAPARGAVIPCGATITTDVTLSSSVGPCASGGIVVTADDVKIDLNGHRIFGSATTGDGAGVRLTGAERVTVKNGTITGFDAGVVIQGGGLNKITRVKAIGNIGDANTLGDGILIDDSPANVILSNEVRANGPFSGVSVIGDGSIGNKIAKNTIQDNDISSNGVNNDVGLRLEANTRQTTVKGNVISFSGLDGVSIFQSSRQNTLTDNTVKYNGFHNEAHRKGDGIRVFGDTGEERNIIKSNRIVDNAAFGLILSLNATHNHVEKNKASRNGFHAAGSFDLADENEGCDSNVWLDNTGSRNRSCIQ